MIITDRDYKRWMNMSRIVCSDKQIAEDLLQELLLNILEKNMSSQIKVVDSYIFISLKNRYMNYLRSLKNKKKDDVYIDLEGSDGTELLEDLSSPDDLEVLIEKNIEDQDKIDVITNTILALPNYEMKLYQLHFIWGLSQRDIAKKIGISHMTINMRVNKIKEKIKENYEKRR
jgi:RNA polymerase sigma factor (sigma-70 family)